MTRTENSGVSDTVAEELRALKVHSERMVTLLENPQYGLSSWWSAVIETLKRISEIAKRGGINE